MPKSGQNCLCWVRLMWDFDAIVWYWSSFAWASSVVSGTKLIVKANVQIRQFVHFYRVLTVTAIWCEGGKRGMK